MPRGYDRALFILPFENCGSFQATSRRKRATREQAVAEIAERFREFVDLFEQTRVHLAPRLSDPIRSEHYSFKEV